MEHPKPKRGDSSLKNDNSDDQEDKAQPLADSCDFIH
jgi:hypothetical protein